ncbi:hypothetical protein VC866_06360 [Citrobacter freundii]|nr:hypothetical protein [Citrobacter freundii]
MSWIRKNALWCAFVGALVMALAIWGTWQGADESPNDFGKNH